MKSSSEAYFNYSTNTKFGVDFSDRVMSSIPQIASELSEFNSNRCHEFLEAHSLVPPDYSPSVRYIISTILLLILCLTILVNSLLIFALLSNKHLQTISSAFTASLVVADMLIAILIMPFRIYQQFNNFIWDLGKSMCLMKTCLEVMLTTASIYNLCCLTIDRYIIICKPFVHQQKKLSSVVVLLLLCWILPIFISLFPIMNNWNHVGTEEYIDCNYSTKDLSVCVLVFNKTFTIITSLISFFIPTVCMVFCYLQIYKVAKYHAQGISLQRQNTQQKQNLRQKTRAKRTIFAITGCFLVCWSPAFVLDTIYLFIGYHIPHIPWTVARWFGYTNSMFNPILICRYNMRYRTAIKRLFKYKMCRGISEFEIKAIPTTDVTNYVSGSPNMAREKLEPLLPDSKHTIQKLNNHPEQDGKAQKTKSLSNST